MGRASFLLESVERGRLGRNSWMGAGSRIVTFEEAEALGLPVVGYLAYDYVAQARADRAAARRRAATSPRAGSSSPRRSSASTTARGRPTWSRATADEIAGRLEGGVPWQRETRGRRRGASPLPRTRAATRRWCASCKEHIVAGDAFQIVPSQRAERPTSALAARRLPRAPPRQPVAVPLPARARRDRARRLLAGAARRLRGRPGEPRARSPARPSRRRATSSACSRRRRTEPST